MSTIASTFSSVAYIAIIYQVNIAEIPVAVVATVAEFIKTGILGTGRTGLVVAVAVRAEYKAAVGVIVQAVVATLACITSSVFILSS